MSKEATVIFNQLVQDVKFDTIDDIYKSCYAFVEANYFELQYVYENKNCVVLSNEMLDFALDVASPLTLSVVERQSPISQNNLGVRPEKRVLLLGLEDSGKTSLMYKLKLDTDVATIPTIGFNVETIDMYGSSFEMWDIGGQEKIRALWKHYYQDVSLLIWAIDSADRSRFDESKTMLLQTLEEMEYPQIPVLIVLSKQDLINPMTVEEITGEFSNGILGQREFLITAKATTGLENEVKRWITSQLSISTLRVL